MTYPQGSGLSYKPFDSNNIENYQSLSGLAGLIDPNKFGPDMPFNVHFIKNLPLAPLRRVLPETPMSFYLDILEAYRPCGDEEEWAYVDGSGSTEMRFELLFSETFGDKCDECDGVGYFTHGSHDYDCRECDGEGDFSHHESEVVEEITMNIQGVFQ